MNWKANIGPTRARLSSIAFSVAFYCRRNQGRTEIVIIAGSSFLIERIRDRLEL